MKYVLYLAVFLIAPLAILHAAEIKLAAVFNDHAVLQRDQVVPVWGSTDAGATVTVEFAGQTKSAMADGMGHWVVKLDPMPASAEPRELKVSGVVVKDVLVGEVWLCGGQSNMEWALSRCVGGPEAVERSANSLLRLCVVPHTSQMSPQTDVAAKWSVSAPNVVKTFSAIGYWFGSKLQKELGVPVGIINNSYGGTIIESWLPLETLKNGPWPQDKRTDIELAKADYERRKEALKPAMEKYEAEKAAALREHKPAPSFPIGWPGDFRGPSVLWNGEVAPLLPYRIRGVAWYQGESNAYAGVAQTYKDLLPALIHDWRQGFGQPDLPFLILQISRNRKPQTDPNELSGIAELQEAQLKTAQQTPHTALVVTDDLGEPDVHYTNKEPAAERALKAALALAYGRTIESSGPVFADMKIDGDKAILRFTHAVGGLESKDGAPQGLVIAGEDKKFVFAEARIEGESIVVSSPQVPKPVAVRYGWADNPKVNLFNKEGLPASPFRTDKWPLQALPKTKQ